MWDTIVAFLMFIWNKLSPDEKEKVKEAAANAVDWLFRQYWRESQSSGAR